MRAYDPSPEEAALPAGRPPPVGPAPDPAGLAVGMATAAARAHLETLGYLVRFTRTPAVRRVPFGSATAVAVARRVTAVYVHRPLTPEEAALAARWTRLAARVVRTAYAARADPATLDALTAVAFSALCEAAAQFDPAAGRPFRAFAPFVIRPRVARALADARRTRAAEAAARTALRHAARARLTADDPAAALAAAEDPAAAVDRLLPHLSDRDRAVLVVKFGLGAGAEPEPGRVVAARFGLTKSRVGQIVRAAREAAAGRPPAAGA